MANDKDGILKDKRFLNIHNSEELDNYFSYICYRVVCDFYHVLNERVPDYCSYADCYELMRTIREAREAAQRVILGSIKDFSVRWHTTMHFENPQPDFEKDGDMTGMEDGRCNAIAIVPVEEGRFMVSFFLFNIQRAFYLKQKEEGGPENWDDYIEWLSTDREAWKTVYETFRDALIKIDYKPAWREEGFIDTILPD